MIFRNSLPGYLQARRIVWTIFKDRFPLRRRSSGCRINVNEMDELFHWTQVLGVPKEKLLMTIDKVGDSVAAVRKALGK
jgi:hypothetical protein